MSLPFFGADDPEDQLGVSLATMHDDVRVSVMQIGSRRDRKRAWGLMVLCLLSTLSFAGESKGNKAPQSLICMDCESDPPPPTTLLRDSIYIAQTVPLTMTAGVVYAASVQMQNTGTATWTLADGYKLGSQSPQDNTAWGSNRVSVAGSVAGGQTATFNFMVTAPSTPGTYQFQWGMVDEGEAWFGGVTPSVTITVIAPPNSPPAVSLTAPSDNQSYIAGSSITMSATASDADGSIQRVEFYADGTKIGEDFSAPYSQGWIGTQGTHAMSAKAIDNTGAMTDSGAIYVTVNTSVVTGSVDGLNMDAAGVYHVSGWACATYLNQSIELHLYVGGGWPVGTFIGAYPANQSSESSLANQCQAQGLNYRFSIPISLALRQQHGGKSIDIHGISPIGGSNNLLSRSGNYSIPLVPMAPASTPSTFIRTDTITYEDNLSKWVIGQIKASTNLDTGMVESRTIYDPSTALPLEIFAFEKLQQRVTYNADGTLASVSNGRDTGAYDTSITLAGWKRGIPQTIGFPDGSSKTAVVDDLGQIKSVTDETGAMTCYEYDLGGRLTKTTFPSDTQLHVCDESRWNATSAVFEIIATPEYGIPAGHWRRKEKTGNYHKLTYFDALWRPIVTEDVDITNMGATNRWTAQRYDAEGRAVFASYPRNPFVAGSVTWNGINIGTRTTYDALGRPTRTEQDSELGLLATTTAYLSGFKTQVTNPRGKVTTTSYMAYDEPSRDLPVAIAHPAGAYTDIVRDTFGKPRMLVRRNASYTEAVTRSFVYDDGQRLCKSIEPETGATVMDYDAAGNLAWSASGLVLPDTSNAACGPDRAVAAASGRRVDRTYTQRDRLSTLTFPDRRGNQVWEYWTDGAPKKITTFNDPSNGLPANPVENTYTYNSRRLMTAETTAQPNWYTWPLGYGYDRNGALSSQTYPTNLTLTYAPNALGQPTSVADTWGRIYASNVSYYPNGGIQQFTYGNGITHTMAQNLRQLPARVTDNWGAMDYKYDYDANTNPTLITDYARGGDYSRWLSYDDMDRLTDAGSCSFGGDCWHHFIYDTLDNIRSWKLAGVKDYADYYYEPNSNRLTNIRNSTGSAIVGLGYDSQGNLTNKNGQLYDFDYGNRLRTIHGNEAYRYDGYGRRALTWRQPGYIMLNMYASNGQLAYQHDESKSKSFDNVYLGGSLVATVEYKHSDWASTIKFHHTDALGSPVAVTDANGFVIERNQYEPYGAVVGKPTYDGIGYTGHVMDGATGLTYMQQRYYDPGIGRFLSVDPVTADGNAGGNFNRYWYANNNPYRFTDPDGRAVERVRDGKIDGADTTVDLKPIVERQQRTSTEAIVIHRTVSSSAQSAVTSAVSTGGKASFHIVIDADGSTTQIANLNNVANHVGKPTGDISNQNSIGIEVVGNYNASDNTWDPVTAAQVEATAQAVYVIGKYYGVSSNRVFPHESVSRKTAGEGGVVISAIADRLNQLNRQTPPPFDSYLSGSGE